MGDPDNTTTTRTAQRPDVAQARVLERRHRLMARQNRGRTSSGIGAVVALVIGVVLGLFLNNILVGFVIGVVLAALAMGAMSVWQRRYRGDALPEDSHIDG